MGPVGSGKTTATMAMDVFFKACRQEPSPRDGVRYSRELIARCTYPRIEQILLKTWLEWMKPSIFGSEPKRGSPITHHIRFTNKQPPGGIVDLEVQFLGGFETLDDLDKVRGLEASRLRLNEATEFSEEVVGKFSERQNRYPKMAVHGVNCTEPGVVMDFNAPPVDHWLYELMELKTPGGYRFWRQPPAVFADQNGPLESKDGTRYRVNPDADNLRWLAPTYYPDYVATHSDQDIKVFLMNEPSFISEGDPVHPVYNDSIHYSRDDLPVYPGLPLLMGFDFGGTPAVVFAQFTPRGQLRFLSELTSEKLTNLPAFLDERVLPHIAQNYPGMQIKGWGDPRGDIEGYEDDAFAELAKRFGEGVVRPAPHRQNRFEIRAAAFDHFLKNNLTGGLPAAIFGPRVQMLRAGVGGRYVVDKIKHGGNAGALRREPKKNAFSHPVEAAHYLCDGLRGQHDESDNKLAALIQSYNRNLRPLDRGAGY
jgi:hypothetical protein